MDPGGQTEDRFAINRYFIDHPEMVLGRQEPVSTVHGMDYTVNPIEGLELSDQLHDAVKYIHGTYQRQSCRSWAKAKPLTPPFLPILM